MTQRVRSLAGRRLHRRAVATLGLVAILLLATMVYFVGYLRDWFPDRYYPAAMHPPVTTAAPSPTPTQLPNSKISVNVYNGSNRSGLAKTTADRLRTARFKVVAVDNDPLGTRYDGVAVVRYGPNAKEEARILLALVKGSVPEVDARTSKVIDLVLGSRWEPTMVPVAPPKS